MVAGPESAYVSFVRSRKLRQSTESQFAEFDSETSLSMSRDVSPRLRLMIRCLNWTLGIRPVWLLSNARKAFTRSLPDARSKFLNLS